jgi:tRNA-specific 2-thiouridylase
MNGPPGKVMLGISGGVDSSVAALLLQQSGYQVEGLFMQNWEEDERSGPCTTDADRKDAVAVCGRLGIPFHARNFAAEYWDGVFEHFLAEYRAGRTPNPDVLCNREIKFKTFLDEAHSLGAEKIATGHYARVDCRDGLYRLLRAVDMAKDQSYFLHALGQHALSATLFPLGEMLKPRVRELALEAALPTHAKKDSTGICFIGERDFRSFLSQYIPARPGEMRTPDGELIGEHQGVMYYTLGQRNGLGIGGRHGASGEAWYVVGKDVAANVLYIAQGGENHWLYSQRLQTETPTWVAGAAPGNSFRCTAKTRYRQVDQSCLVTVLDGGLEVRFDEPQRAVTPGQSVVFYDDEVCLGGAVIAMTDAPYGGLLPAFTPSPTLTSATGEPRPRV